MTEQDIRAELRALAEERQDAFIDGLLEKVRLLAEKAVRKDYDPTVHEKQAFAEIVGIVDDMKGWF